MDITKDTENEVFENIKYLINECDFIAIDTEFTGLTDKNNNFYDTSDMRYSFVKDHSMQYTILQFGTCIFKYNELKRCFDYLPINFHLKPYGFESQLGNFFMNSSTVDFLNKNKFDFNWVFEKGLNFVRYSEYQTKLSSYDLNLNQDLRRLNFDVNLYDFSNVEDLIVRCTEYLENQIEEEPFFIDYPTERYKAQLILNFMWKKVGCINGMWISATFDNDNPEKKSQIKISKVVDIEEGIIKSKTDKKTKLAENNKFIILIQHIIESQKTVVAHNSFLDFMHIIDKFVVPLPETYSEFKVLINKLFPRIFDTKYMLSDDLFKTIRSNNLKISYDCLKNSDSFLNPDTVSQPTSDELNFESTENYHCAHFDAMITGKIFVSLACKLMCNDIEKLANFATGIPENLKRFLNRVKVVNAEIGFLNLIPGSVEKYTSRRFVYLMTIPNSWRNIDIHNYLSNLFGKSFKVMFEQSDIRWINRDSCTIKLPQCVDLSKIPTEPDKIEDVTLVPFNNYYDLTDSLREVDADGFCKVKKRKTNSIHK